MFGVAINQDAPHNPDEGNHVLAARIQGKGSAGPLNAIVIADADLMSEQFFELRRRGIENLNFDNVTFLLNCVDQLAGDPSFIALRKRRPKQRTLEAVEARTRTYEAQRLHESRTGRSARRPAPEGSPGAPGSRRARSRSSAATWTTRPKR